MVRHMSNLHLCLSATSIAQNKQKQGRFRVSIVRWRCIAAVEISLHVDVVDSLSICS